MWEIALGLLLTALTLASCGDSGTSDGDEPATSSGSNSSSQVSSSSVMPEVSSSSSILSCTNTYGENTVTDCRDGQTYKTVVIGTQTWMAENLNYSGDDSSGNRTYTKGWCYGVGGEDTTNHSDSTTCDTYGRFYNWTDAMGISQSYLRTTWDSIDTVNHQGICPFGWHVPTNAEWNTLVNFLGGTDTAGYFLKSTSGWYSSGNGSDAFGFSARPAGGRDLSGDWYNQGSEAYFWSTSEYSASFARSRYLYYYYTYFSAGSYYKNRAFSLRCSKNR
ncbi:MAG TPA: fibrobacter succinogenes major paralogous domain-containing protein [Fibrobacteraceae bacterium]|nr:fibrobacter succinogenes major paralogous domain-containing protein [Fibrobacteraceae bacterium]